MRFWCNLEYEAGHSLLLGDFFAEGSVNRGSLYSLWPESARWECAVKIVLFLDMWV